jgi:cobalt-zinc-cadmium efflux system protein
LISDSIHNLSDTISLFISGIAILFSKKKATKKFTFGYKRGEILAAFFNSTTLIIISGYLVFSGIKRLFYPETISGELMTIIAVIGLFGNIASVFFLRKSSKDNLNMKTAYLHLVADSLSSIVVILGGIAILKWQEFLKL